MRYIKNEMVYVTLQHIMKGIPIGKHVAQYLSEVNETHCVVQVLPRLNNEYAGLEEFKKLVVPYSFVEPIE